jgi:hypothetical protein
VFLFYLFAGIVLFLGVLLGWRAFIAADPARLARRLRALLPIIIMAVGGLIALRFGALAPLILAFGLPWILPQLRRMRQGGLGGGSGAGNQGRVSMVMTDTLRVSLDHDSGEMSGDVLSGSFMGRALDDMDQHEIGQLAAEIAPQDSDGIAILREYFQRRFGEPLEFEPDEDFSEARQRGASAFDEGPMTADQAARLLGVEADADEDTIQSAWRSAMKGAHPDRGGSAELAARINAARDILLGRRH